MALRFLRTISIFAVLVGFAGGGIYLWGQSIFLEPGPLPEKHIVLLPPGENVRAIGELLRAEGVIGNALIFELGARLTKKSRLLKAGEYEISPHVSMKQVVDILVEGKVVIHRLTIAEGLVIREIIDIVNSTQGLEGKVTAKFAEGSLLPETYHFIRGDNRNLLVERMQMGMKQTLSDLWGERDKTIPIQTPNEAVILASIVEKETGLATERPHIAGVFMNRLRKGMKLQSDPTVSFGITHGKQPLGRKLSRKDLTAPTPYNTYTIIALPPTPIANPGTDALRAVLKPMATKDLFFVADGKGGHRFAETYAQHQQNVKLWRKVSK